MSDSHRTSIQAAIFSFPLTRKALMSPLYVFSPGFWFLHLFHIVVSSLLLTSSPTLLHWFKLLFVLLVILPLACRPHQLSSGSLMQVSTTLFITSLITTIILFLFYLYQSKSAHSAIFFSFSLHLTSFAQFAASFNIIIIIFSDRELEKKILNSNKDLNYSTVIEISKKKKIQTSLSFLGSRAIQFSRLGFLSFVHSAWY